MSQIVEVNASQPSLLGGLQPDASEVGPPQRAILRPHEVEAVIAWRDEPLQVRRDVRHQVARSEEEAHKVVQDLIDSKGA
jgi:hypothetical protein